MTKKQKAQADFIEKIKSIGIITGGKAEEMKQAVGIVVPCVAIITPIESGSGGEGEQSFSA